jgi:type VI protein secretion system component VasK
MAFGMSQQTLKHCLVQLLTYGIMAIAFGVTGHYAYSDGDFPWGSSIYWLLLIGTYAAGIMWVIWCVKIGIKIGGQS